jgi:hypothetical protein
VPAQPLTSQQSSLPSHWHSHLPVIGTHSAVSLRLPSPHSNVPCPRALLTLNAKQAQAKEAWGSALARASGKKVLDDPRLLKRSIKREERAKEKKGKAWKERLSKQAEQQAAKQQK